MGFYATFEHLKLLIVLRGEGFRCKWAYVRPNLISQWWCIRAYMCIVECDVL